MVHLYSPQSRPPGRDREADRSYVRRSGDLLGAYVDLLRLIVLHKNLQIAKPWARYRPMIYLAADSGMRPQEYLAVPVADLLERGVRITQALDRSNRIGPPKSRAARRYIPVSRETMEMTRGSRLGFAGNMGLG